VPVIGVPKTIDNDIGGTEITFGFDTALNIATEAIDRLHTTAESHHRAMVIELMGRDAGFIALNAGVSGGADVILIPEIPFKFESIMAKIHARAAKGRKFSILAVSEGAKAQGGAQVFSRKGDEVYVPRLGGVGQMVGEYIEQQGFESRVTVLGHCSAAGLPPLLTAGLPHAMARQPSVWRRAADLTAWWHCSAARSQTCRSKKRLPHRNG
jgi:ATP-dependent phosphofructokinase / diphosphate-dependent phosphofructokinase